MLNRGPFQPKPKYIVIKNRFELLRNPTNARAKGPRFFEYFHKGEELKPVAASEKVTLVTQDGLM